MDTRGKRKKLDFEDPEPPAGVANKHDLLHRNREVTGVKQKTTTETWLEYAIRLTKSLNKRLPPDLHGSHSLCQRVEDALQKARQEETKLRQDVATATQTAATAQAAVATQVIAAQAAAATQDTIGQESSIRALLNGGADGLSQRAYGFWATYRDKPRTQRTESAWLLSRAFVNIQDFSDRMKTKIEEANIQEVAAPTPEQQIRALQKVLKEFDASTLSPQATEFVRAVHFLDLDRNHIWKILKILPAGPGYVAGYIKKKNGEPGQEMSLQSLMGARFEVITGIVNELDQYDVVSKLSDGMTAFQKALPSNPVEEEDAAKDSANLPEADSNDNMPNKRVPNTGVDMLHFCEEVNKTVDKVSGVMLERSAERNGMEAELTHRGVPQPDRETHERLVYLKYRLERIKKLHNALGWVQKLSTIYQHLDQLSAPPPSEMDPPENAEDYVLARRVEVQGTFLKGKSRDFVFLKLIRAITAVCKQKKLYEHLIQNLQNGPASIIDILQQEGPSVLGFDIAAEVSLIFEGLRGGNRIIETVRRIARSTEKPNEGAIVNQRDPAAGIRLRYSSFVALIKKEADDIFKEGAIARARVDAAAGGNAAPFKKTFDDLESVHTVLDLTQGICNFHLLARRLDELFSPLFMDESKEAFKVVMTELAPSSYAQAIFTNIYTSILDMKLCLNVITGSIQSITNLKADQAMLDSERADALEQGADSLQTAALPVESKGTLDALVSSIQCQAGRWKEVLKYLREAENAPDMGIKYLDSNQESLRRKLGGTFDVLQSFATALKPRCLDGLLGHIQKIANVLDEGKWPLDEATTNSWCKTVREEKDAVMEADNATGQRSLKFLTTLDDLSTVFKTVNEWYKSDAISFQEQLGEIKAKAPSGSFIIVTSNGFLEKAEEAKHISEVVNSLGDRIESRKDAQGQIESFIGDIELTLQNIVPRDGYKKQLFDLLDATKHLGNYYTILDAAIAPNPPLFRESKNNGNEAYGRVRSKIDDVADSKLKAINTILCELHINSRTKDRLVRAIQLLTAGAEGRPSTCNGQASLMEKGARLGEMKELQKLTDGTGLRELVKSICCQADRLFEVTEYLKNARDAPDIGLGYLKDNEVRLKSAVGDVFTDLQQFAFIVDSRCSDVLTTHVREIADDLATSIWPLDQQKTTDLGKRIIETRKKLEESMNAQSPDIQRGFRFFKALEDLCYAYDLIYKWSEPGSVFFDPNKAEGREKEVSEIKDRVSEGSFIALTCQTFIERLEPSVSFVRQLGSLNEDDSTTIDALERDVVDLESLDVQRFGQQPKYGENGHIRRFLERVVAACEQFHKDHDTIAEFVRKLASSPVKDLEAMLQSVLQIQASSPRNNAPSLEKKIMGLAGHQLPSKDHRRDYVSLVRRMFRARKGEQVLRQYLISLKNNQRLCDNFRENPTRRDSDAALAYLRSVPPEEKGPRRKALEAVGAIEYIKRELRAMCNKLQEPEAPPTPGDDASVGVIEADDKWLEIALSRIRSNMESVLPNTTRLLDTYHDRLDTELEQIFYEGTGAPNTRSIEERFARTARTRLVRFAARLDKFMDWLRGTQSTLEKVRTSLLLSPPLNGQPTSDLRSTAGAVQQNLETLRNKIIADTELQEAEPMSISKVVSLVIGEFNARKSNLLEIVEAVAPYGFVKQQNNRPGQNVALFLRNNRGVFLGSKFLLEWLGANLEEDGSWRDTMEFDLPPTLYDPASPFDTRYNEIIKRIQANQSLLRGTDKDLVELRNNLFLPDEGPYVNPRIVQKGEVSMNLGKVKKTCSRCIKELYGVNVMPPTQQSTLLKLVDGLIKKKRTPIPTVDTNCVALVNMICGATPADTTEAKAAVQQLLNATGLPDIPQANNHLRQLIDLVAASYNEEKNPGIITTKDVLIHLNNEASYYHDTWIVTNALGDLIGVSGDPQLESLASVFNSLLSDRGRQKMISFRQHIDTLFHQLTFINTNIVSTDENLFIPTPHGASGEPKVKNIVSRAQRISHKSSALRSTLHSRGTPFKTSFPDVESMTDELWEKQEKSDEKIKGVNETLAARNLELKALQTQLTAADAELAAADQRIAEIDALLKEFQQSREGDTNTTALGAVVRRLQEELARSKADCEITTNAQKAKIESLKNDLSNMEQNTKEVKEQLSAKTSELNKQQTELTAAREKLTAAMQRVAELEISLKRCQETGKEDTIEIRQRYEESQKELVRCQEELSKARSLQSQLQKDVDRLQADLQVERVRFEDLTKQLDDPQRKELAAIMERLQKELTEAKVLEMGAAVGEFTKKAESMEKNRAEALKEHLAILEKERAERIAERKVIENLIKKLEKGKGPQKGGSILKATDVKAAAIRFARDHGEDSLYVIGPDSLDGKLANATLITNPEPSVLRNLLQQGDVLFVGEDCQTPTVQNTLLHTKHGRVNFLMTEADIKALSKEKRRLLRKVLTKQRHR
jgi:hypothetical protein